MVEIHNKITRKECEVGEVESVPAPVMLRVGDKRLELVEFNGAQTNEQATFDSVLLVLKNGKCSAQSSGKMHTYSFQPKIFIYDVNKSARVIQSKTIQERPSCTEIYALPVKPANKKRGTKTNQNILTTMK